MAVTGGTAAQSATLEYCQNAHTVSRIVISNDRSALPSVRVKV